MKLVRLDYDSHEDFNFITVKMSRKEAAGLVNLLGKLNGYGQKRLNIEGAPNYNIDLGSLNDSE